jgi:hypothetical protein
MEESQLESLAEGFLKNIPESDRQIVERYVREWDGNVTRQFQRIHAQYEPYKALGELETVQRAVYMNQLLQEDPLEFRARFEAVLEELAEQGLIEMPQLEDDGDEEEFVPQGQNPEVERLARLEQQMIEFAEMQEQNQQAAVEAEQMRELDKVLESLHTRDGKKVDFDEDWVLLQISRGVDPEEAVDAWNSMIESKVGSLRAPKTIPKVMRGSGTTPGGQAGEPKKFTTAAERTAYMVQMLQEAANS